MIFTAPTRIQPTRPSVFLAGSIEMGKAVDWQSEMGEFFSNQGLDVFNPRRKEWDSGWEQSFDNPNFYQQVNWELNALEKADNIFVYLAPETLSPISLLEIGIYHRKNMVIVCPETFYRRGNIEILCDRAGIPLYESLEDYKERYL